MERALLMIFTLLAFHDKLVISQDLDKSDELQVLDKSDVLQNLDKSDELQKSDELKVNLTRR